ncbi:response regulator [Pseudomonas entomophila]|uniref:response regulator n=1 Tax=Pseudomonas entomophila TaxID=312306 RepID=UPI0015E2D10A|nr:response regulator [Pseudomonas entomophila]MBA1189150.1 response regulator [Pseudomonas entomophila]
MSKVKVLVVDDAPFIRDLVRKCLRNTFAGVAVEDAVNGRKAQVLLTRERFDLVLCDWEMPEMSGLELLAWCRQQPSMASMPFIMVTSRGDKENVIQAIQAGVSDFVGKPFTNEQLSSKVKKAMAKIGRLADLVASAPVRPASTGNDSLAALTSGRSEAPRPAAGSAPAPAPAPAVPQRAPAAAPAAVSSPGPGRGQGQLRLASGAQPCVIKALSLKEALLVVRRGEALPQVLESAVLDLEQGEQAETARLNGYLHAVAALEPRPESDWLQLTFKFVDQDAQKLDYLSRLIARGTAQKHFTPGA